jgi:hypothetical protein
LRSECNDKALQNKEIALLFLASFRIWLTDLQIVNPSEICEPGVFIVFSMLLAKHVNTVFTHVIAWLFTHSFYFTLKQEWTVI